MNIKNKLFNIGIPYMMSGFVSFYALINSNLNNNTNNVNNVVRIETINNNLLEYENNLDATMAIKITNDLSDNVFERSLESIIKNYTTNDVKRLAKNYAYIDNGRFNDNMHYKIIRRLDAEQQIIKYKPRSDHVIIIDKTFQKGLIFKKTVINKSNNNDANSNDTDINNIDNDVFNKSNYRFVEEFDCTTGKIYGKKQFDGDGKTPEGIFNIQSVKASHNNLFDGKKAYGPYFMRIYHSIGIHGNGTDTTKVRRWKNDKAYTPPDPLGITKKNNFGYGISHACIRFDNSIIREKISDGTLRAGTQVIIHEDKKLTTILTEAYHPNNYRDYNLYASISGSGF